MYILLPETRFIPFQSRKKLTVDRYLEGALCLHAVILFGCHVLYRVDTTAKGRRWCLIIPCRHHRNVETMWIRKAGFRPADLKKALRCVVHKTRRAVLNSWRQDICPKHKQICIAILLALDEQCTYTVVFNDIS